MWGGFLTAPHLAFTHREGQEEDDGPDQCVVGEHVGQIVTG